MPACSAYSAQLQRKTSCYFLNNDSSSATKKNRLSLRLLCKNTKNSVIALLMCIDVFSVLSQIPGYSLMIWLVPERAYGMLTVCSHCSDSL